VPIQPCFAGTNDLGESINGRPFAIDLSDHGDRGVSRISARRVADNRARDLFAGPVATGVVLPPSGDPDHWGREAP
jgi:hypothetical protein